MLGAGESRFNRLGHELMCPCGCKQILLECNHVGCVDSARMIDELKTQMAAGGNDTAVLNWFVAKYGATILAAPIRGGFDTVARIVPVAILFLATIGSLGTVWLWRRRTLQMAGAAGFDSGDATGNLPGSGESNPQDAALRERIRRETEY